MNTLILALMICSIIPITCAWVSGYYRHQQLGTVDNKHPREQNTQLSGPGQRAVAAQANAWEALAVLIATSVAVVASGLEIDKISTLLWVFVGCRIAHMVTYLANQDIVRSLAFLVGVEFSILLVPVNRWLAIKIAKLSTSMMVQKDQRVKVGEKHLALPCSKC